MRNASRGAVVPRAVGFPLRLAGAAAAALAAASCGGDGDEADPGPGGTPPPQGGAFHFVDATAESGLTWRHAGVPGAELVAAYDHGSGMAAGDFDGDGHEDLFFLNNCGPAGYFLGRGDGTFVDASDELPPLDDGVGSAVAYGDYDLDGDVDFYVTFTQRPNALLAQQEDGGFVDVAPASGVAATGHFTSAAFADVDLDGDLDLAVAATMHFTSDTERWPARGRCPEMPMGLASENLGPQTPSDPSALFINGGEAAGFRFTEEAALRGVPTGGTGERTRDFADLAFADFDRDGDPDLVLVAMFDARTTLLVNDGSGRFDDFTAEALPRPSWGALGAAIADYDGNGWPDLLLTDMHSDMWIRPGDELDGIDGSLRYRGASGPDPDGANVGDEPDGPIYGNTLWLNQGAGRDFRERSAAWQAELFQPWGAVPADFDNDGDIDVFVPSGMGNPFDYWPNAYLENAGDRFVQRQRDLGLDPPPGGASDPEVRIEGQPYVASSRAAAAADFDEDGDLDLAILNYNSTPHLLLGQARGDRGWLQVRLTGRDGAPAHGAWVEVEAGQDTYARWYDGGTPTYLSQGTAVLHFGLGRAERADAVTVRWADGTMTRIESPDPGVLAIAQE